MVQNKLMAVDESGKIDFLVIDESSGIIYLTVSDHLDWDDEINHLRILQSKIYDYIEFIESGQILEHIPDVKDQHVVMDIVHKYPITDDAKRLCILFLARPKIEFGFRVLKDN